MDPTGSGEVAVEVPNRGTDVSAEAADGMRRAFLRGALEVDAPSGCRRKPTCAIGL